MARPRRTLLGTITELATQTFGQPVSNENWNNWQNHWVQTGEMLYQSFVQEGLPLTSAAVKRHVDWAKTCTRH
jgi:cell envelope opacity-associated protein A